MKRSLLKFSSPIGKHVSGTAAAFSTASGGRGRGRGGSSSFNIASTSPLGKPISNNDNQDQSVPPPIPTGTGHGRGVINSNSNGPIPPAQGAGRGRGTVGQDVGPKKPLFFLRMEEDEAKTAQKSPSIGEFNREKKELPSAVISVLSGAGRGKPSFVVGGSGEETNFKRQENRHIRPKKPESGDTVTPAKKLTTEDAVKNAMGILSKGDGGSGGGGGRERMEAGGGRGGRGRGGRGGRGMRGRGGRGGRGRGDWRDEEEVDGDDDAIDGLFVGDDADGEKFAQRVGPEVMSELAEGFEDMAEYVLPTPELDTYIDAMHTNYMIECEPEWRLGDFESNPDIDEKPPMPLREVLEKVKPFIMAYENIQSQEEWEEVVEATMKHVPLMKEIVDYYAGPDKVTAKQQGEELERVANTLPASAPSSVKRFTDRAVMSLQSNPGWGFDKKCQFMDKLVWEVSQQYK